MRWLYLRQVVIVSCEGRDRTSDLRVMSPPSYRCSTSRYKINNWSGSTDYPQSLDGPLFTHCPLKWSVLVLITGWFDYQQRLQRSVYYDLKRIQSVHYVSRRRTMVVLTHPSVKPTSLAFQPTQQYLNPSQEFIQSHSYICTSNGIRTRITSVKGKWPNP